MFSQLPRSSRKRKHKLQHNIPHQSNVFRLIAMGSAEGKWMCSGPVGQIPNSRIQACGEKNGRKQKDPMAWVDARDGKESIGRQQKRQLAEAPSGSRSRLQIQPGSPEFPKIALYPHFCGRSSRDSSPSPPPFTFTIRGEESCRDLYSNLAATSMTT